MCIARRYHVSSGSHQISANALGPSVTSPARAMRRASSTGTRRISVGSRWVSPSSTLVER